MEQQKRIDKILQAVETRVQDEVGALLGAEFVLDSADRKLVSKAEAFEGLLGKQVCAHLEITGDISGKSCLLMSIKDAIRLGGTLIMLPDAELQEVIGREEYREEIEDSYGEIANIIAGSITKDFEEMYPKPCRFIRKEQEVLVPAKVDIESDTPVINEQFYLASCSMFLDGRQMGNMILLLPAAAFGLEKEQEPEAPAVEAAVMADKPAQEQPAAVKADEQSAPPREPVEHSPEAIQKAEPPKVDFEKQKKKVDRLLAECQKKLSAEASALLGVDVIFDDIDNRIIGKEEFFTERTVGKQVITDMEVVGDFQDTCHFTISLKDAIQLGGILIMLPPAELVNVIAEEDFSEDTTDAYGEVANIVSGVYTAVFEEQYSKKLRYIKKRLQLVVPLKVDIASDEPIPDKLYYASSMSLMVEGRSLGNVCMLFPVSLLQLDSQPPEKIAEPVAPVASSGAADASAPKIQTDRSPASPEKPVKKKTQITAEAKDQLDKHRKRVDKLLGICSEKMESEVSTLLGFDVKLSNQTNTVIGKEPFFAEFVSGKQVIADMDVVGELEGKSHLIVNLRDAIRIGGALIMLPSSELESVVAEEEFGEDTKDAFGEIANIIAGVYTGVFEEQYTKRLRFIKTDLHQVVPMKVEPDADEPFPNDQYYLSTMDLSMDEVVLGKVNIIFPLELLQLEGLRADKEGAEDEEVDVADLGAIEISPRPVSGRSDVGGSADHPAPPVPPDILLIGDDEAEAAKIASVLQGMGFSVKSLSFKDNVHNYLPGRLKAIYLVMKDVNEQAFGAAIKVSSACSLPLIAAGPGWTRTKVMKAVKYGVLDILLTPAAKEDIEENVANNLLKLAA
jgi:chemotaxis protein CheY-P-specific phosphatase CheC